MNQKEAAELIDRYLQGKASRQEETIVQSWLMKQTSSTYKDKPDTEYPLPAGIWNNISESIHQTRRYLWLRVAIAAAVTTIIFGVGLFIYKNQQKENSEIVMLANDIKAGTVGATLTLANGKKIRLSDAVKGKITEEDGVTITKSADGKLSYDVIIDGKIANDENKFNTLSTAKGETYQVHLPDGSLVWLNAASSLTYSTNLRVRGKRRVRLDGEGYFEIAKDKVHPFVVESKGQEVEVLGTHFNVNAYADERAMITTLLEGSINVTQNGRSAKLIPGQQSVNTGNNIQISQADTEFAVAWKNNKFIFDSQHIEDIMRMIERWYNVEVIYTANVPKETFWGSISRFDNVSKVLEKLESTEKVHFKIEGRKIYVSP